MTRAISDEMLMAFADGELAPAEQEDGLGSGLEQAFSANSAADFVMLSDSFAGFSIPETPKIKMGS